MQHPRFLSSALAVLLVVLATAAALADDSEIIATCVQGETDAGRSPQACIGRVADPCLQSDAGQTTVGMVQCNARETDVWDAMLNEEYKRLLSLLEGKAADDVRKAQRIWITSRDADCSVPYELFEGGTMAQPIAANCVLTQTADRAIQVRAWREMAQPEAP